MLPEVDLIADSDIVLFVGDATQVPRKKEFVDWKYPPRPDSTA